MSITNGIATELVRLDARVSHHSAAIDKLADELKEIRNTQTITNTVLIELNTTLKNTNQTLAEHKKIDEEARAEVKVLQSSHNQLVTSHGEEKAKFKIVLGIIAAVGAAFLAGAIKLFFFTGGV